MAAQEASERERAKTEPAEVYDQLREAKKKLKADGILDKALQQD